MATSFAAASDAFHVAADTCKVAAKLTLVPLLPYVLTMAWLVLQRAWLGVLWGLSLSMTFSSVHSTFAILGFEREARRVLDRGRPGERSMVPKPVTGQAIASTSRTVTLPA